MITKVFANGQVWDLWGAEYDLMVNDICVTYINSSYTQVVTIFNLEGFKDFEVLVQEPSSQRTETPESQEISSKQGDCIAELVHTLAVELQLTYSYHPATKEFLVDYNDYTFKLKSSDDIGKLRHLVSLMEELSYE
ncbi:hypothetical protein AXI76_gp063 [Pseudoalteromonas phage H101]|uniref:Uncharacterized protein n=1 Tax=Pseudoalteromonas phage H101 TaxID=1654919 RepID=A0A0H4IN40_9CAUD|nr:hypothetical protein AXI76_gp063 [Pseudoalteromonas phage H101]AKO60964.1 hypothetical protein [Pseudoalteromonas phage H101]